VAHDSISDPESAYIREMARRTGGHSAIPCIVTNCDAALGDLQEMSPRANVNHIIIRCDVEDINLLLIDSTTLYNIVLWASKVKLGGVIILRDRELADFWFKYIANRLWGQLKTPDTLFAARRMDILEEREPLMRRSAEWWLRREHYTSFLGIKILQRWVDLVVWEHLLNACSELRTIIELGTAAGGMAAFLRLQTLQRGMQFHTFDIERPKQLDTGEVAKRLDLATCFHQVDLLSDEKQQVIDILNEPESHPMLLFIDLFKPRMFGEFAPHLQEGDIVGVHDFSGQFFRVHTELMQDRLEPLFFGECEDLGGITRFWKVVA